MLVINVGKWDISKEIVSMMMINPWMVSKDKKDHLIHPVVGKWMTNLVATTPIMAKAMKSLYTKLNRQKDLKRTYRQRYKDLQAVVTMTTDSPVTVTHPVIVTSNKVTTKPQVKKAAQEGQGKRAYDKGKAKPLGKGKKNVAKSIYKCSHNSWPFC